MRKRESGQSAVEFALVLPILLLLICGIIDFGWLFYNQLSVENSCREGARVACVNATASDLPDVVKNKVKATLPNNLKGATNVTTRLTNSCDPLAGDVEVKVTANMRTLTPVLGTIYGKTRTITCKVVMKAES